MATGRSLDAVAQARSARPPVPGRYAGLASDPIVRIRHPCSRPSADRLAATSRPCAARAGCPRPTSTRPPARSGSRCSRPTSRCRSSATSSPRSRSGRQGRRAVRRAQPGAAGHQDRQRRADRHPRRRDPAAAVREEPADGDHAGRPAGRRQDDPRRQAGPLAQERRATRRCWSRRDLQRPNAVDQLQVVGEQAGVAVFAPEPGNGGRRPGARWPGTASASRPGRTAATTSSSSTPPAARRRRRADAAGRRHPRRRGARRDRCSSSTR